MYVCLSCVPGGCGGQEGSTSPGTRVRTIGRWRWMCVLGPVTDFTCFYLRLQGSSLSACLNLHLPKAHTSSTKWASLWPRSSPSISKSISCAFLQLVHVIRSQVIILLFPEFTGVLPTRQEYRVSLTNYLYIPRKAKTAKYHSCTPGESFGLPTNQCSLRHLST